MELGAVFRVFDDLDKAEAGGLNGTQQGRVELELATGALIAASIQQKIHGTIMVRGLPVPIEITGVSAIRAIDRGSQ